MTKISQKLSPFLWFDTQAEEAARFYTSLFKNSSIGKMTYYGKGTRGQEGTVMTVAFTIEGMPFVALNGGPIFKFNESISFVINCEDQTEIDMFWENLSAGGEKSRCGWLKDKFGLSWQVVPAKLDELISNNGPEKGARVMAALMKMDKLIIKTLEEA